MQEMYLKYIHSTAMQEKLYKRTLTVVVMSQIFGGAGLAAGITVGALIAQDMLGTTSYAGLPAALFTLGSALSAFLVGRLSQRFGRRQGLSLGFITGGVGAIGVILAAVINNIWLLFFALFIYGAGTSTNLQARYAGADLASEKKRATAVSIAMISTTLGAVAGPNMVTPMGKVASLMGIPPLAGPFILAAVAYILAGLTLFIYLRPDPFLVAKAIAEKREKQAHDSEHDVGKLHETTINRVGIITGALVLVLSHVVMVAIMTMTPIHMQDHGTGLTAVGIVIGLHIAAMYLPSVLTGRLVDKLGRHVMVFASGITLAISGLMAAFAPGESLFWMAFALILLGIGWNFGLISGTAIIVDSTNMQIRAKTQGSVDVWVALGGTAGSLLSGVIVSYSSYAMLGFLGTYLSVLLIAIIIWERMKDKRHVNG
ncbi:MFS family permease [Cerasibacillus quisquiliarum]|uniref:Putative MFS-type transporter YdeG n=1 Tax=Cerasibacillus quisquiliarum TaxID=227865 RepID=A0A511UYH3_9BACI|nr:MFS transporter [Cerasibacillus quisquiliarum]MBB5146820.1 MFS family permease [Cerasibacillus quisquiliarum]GEN31686.1 putative MFS-type transporter YdeG [Cerasibacillus quisquiliarum]